MRRSSTVKVEVRLHPGKGALGDEATLFVAASDIPTALEKLPHLIACNYTIVSVTT